MADLRRFIEAAEENKRATDRWLKAERIKELNQYHLRKVRIELLNPNHFDMYDPKNITAVVGILSVISSDTNSCYLDRPEPSDKGTISISRIAGIYPA